MAFGGVAVDQEGPTRDFPSASMLTGLAANALGWHWSDRDVHQALQDRLIFAVRREREPRASGILTDVQNVQLSKADKAGRLSACRRGATERVMEPRIAVHGTTWRTRQCGSSCALTRRRSSRRWIGWPNRLSARLARSSSDASHACPRAGCWTDGSMGTRPTRRCAHFQVQGRSVRCGRSGKGLKPATRWSALTISRTYGTGGRGCMAGRGRWWRDV